MSYFVRMYYEMTQGIEVEVVPEFVPEESSPEASQYVFAYHITITNRGETEVQLMSRHWIITDGHGVVREVKGPGVVGEQPVLKPGDKLLPTDYTHREHAWKFSNGQYSRSRV
jgi:ApaG protein